MTSTHFRRAYDHQYFDSLDALDEARIHRKIAALFRLLGQPLPSGAVLDAGCGAGHALTFFLRNGATRVVGVDRFPEVLGMAAERARGVPVCSADLDVPLPFEDASFDFVFSHEVIEHLHRPEQFLREVHRALRPGGRVLLKTPNALDWKRGAAVLPGVSWYADADKTHVQYFSVFSIRRLLSDAGFHGAIARAGTKPLFRLGRGGGSVLVPGPMVIGNGLAAVATKE